MTQLNIWLLKDGEQLPLLDNPKKMRMWRLGEVLSNRGHHVTWFSSNFHHMEKRKLCEESLNYKIADTFILKLLEAGSYKKNLSLGRIFHHRRLGKRFKKISRKMSQPDVILVAHPIIDFSYEAVQYGEKHNIPVIIDIRDMWPDTFKDYFPGGFGYLVNRCTYFMQKKTQEAFQGAEALVSMSPDLLSWAVNKAKSSKKTGLFYLGCDESKISIEPDTAKVKRIKKQSEGKTVFLYLGVLGAAYDIQTIVDVAKMRHKNGDTESFFVIAGDGEKKKLYQQSCSEYNNIIFPGWVNKIESHVLMGLADVFLIPNVAQAIPNKFFEGLKYGKPILFTLYGYGKEILEQSKCGFYYKPGDANALTNLIDRMHSASERDICKKNALGLYKEEFTSEKIYAAFADFVEKIAHEKKK